MKVLCKAMVLACLLFSACGTPSFVIHNKKAPVETSLMEEKEEWHFDGVFMLVEFSDPVDLNQRCPQGWDSFGIGKPFRHFISGFLVLTIPFIFDPHNVRYQCRKNMNLNKA